MLVALVLLAPAAAQAQGAPSRIGLLCAATCKSPYHDALLSGLRDLSYVEGRNMTIERRAAGGRDADLPALAAQLVALKVRLIVTDSSSAALAAKGVTSTVPIVMAVSSNAEQSGLVRSLARPGGNVTGVSLMTPELSVKVLELLSELAPGVSRVAILWNPLNPHHQPTLRLMEPRAAGLNLRVKDLPAGGAADLDAAFSAARAWRAQALIVLADTTLDSERKRLVELALADRLLLLSPIQAFTESGGFMSYGANPTDMFRQSALFVDKILRGAKPSELPVAQPVKFDLVINLATAKALGITIPAPMLLRADRVIE